MENDEELKNSTPSIEKSEKNTPVFKDTDDLGPVPNIVSERYFDEEDSNGQSEESSQEPPLNDDDYTSEENEEGTRVLNSSEELRDEFGPSAFDSGFTSEPEIQSQVEVQENSEEKNEIPTITRESTAAPEDWSQEDDALFWSDVENSEESPNIEPSIENAEKAPSPELHAENLEAPKENLQSSEPEKKTN